MNELASRLKRWKDDGEAPPLIAQVHFTNRCNLSCDFCPTVASRERGELDSENELDKEEWLRVIEEGNELGVKEWHICGGGEPLFDKSMALELMRKIKERGSRVEIITNGTLVDKEVAEEIVEMGWDLVTFSLDGPDEKTNDAIRSEGSFREAVKNAKYLSSIRENGKPYLVVHTVLCNENYEKTGEIVKLVDEIGFDEIRFNSMNIWNEAGEELRLDESKKEKAREELLRAKEIARRKDVETNVDEFVEHNFLEHSNEIDEVMKEGIEEEAPGFSNLSCYYPWYNVSIFPEGRVVPCFLFHEGINIKNKSLEEIWYGDFFEGERERFFRNELRKVCKNCNAWNVEKMKKIRERLRS